MELKNIYAVFREFTTVMSSYTLAQFNDKGIWLLDVVDELLLPEVDCFIGNDNKHNAISG